MMAASNANRRDMGGGIPLLDDTSGVGSKRRCQKRKSHNCKHSSFLAILFICFAAHAPASLHNAFGTA
ncbi:MAG: hypothetical protein LBJ03_01930, partial [Holosporales bacterium]|nr:hypothetical protein [Holosporales bacterium]